MLSFLIATLSQGCQMMLWLVPAYQVSDPLGDTTLTVGLVAS